MGKTAEEIAAALNQEARAQRFMLKYYQTSVKNAEARKAAYMAQYERGRLFGKAMAQQQIADWAQEEVNGLKNMWYARNAAIEAGILHLFGVEPLQDSTGLLLVPNGEIGRQYDFHEKKALFQMYNRVIIERLHDITLIFGGGIGGIPAGNFLGSPSEEAAKDAQAVFLHGFANEEWYLGTGSVQPGSE